MKRLLPLLLALLPLLVVAQSAPISTVPVPAQIQFAGLRLRLTDGGRAAVQQKVDALRRHPASFQTRVALADAYFPIIDRVFQKEGIPLDFRYLCLQESGLQGDAQSIHDAVGYWQFKREAASDFGLVINDQVDERKHLVAATQGAAKYLHRSQRMYQNWLHSLLSYNLGPGGVKPYTLPTDANATEMEITEKTHVYVLTFLAHKLAYEPAVGMNPRPVMMIREYPAIGGQPLAVLAQAIQTDANELAKHNRWLLAKAVPTDKSYTALVPVTDSLQLLAMAVQQKQNAPQLVVKPETDAQNAAFVTVNGLRAVVALPNESKEDLARRAQVKLRKFMQYNDLMPFDNIVVGQPYFTQKKRDKAAVEYHVAQAGESVASVSQKYGVRSKAIRSKNRMAGNDPLLPGRVLWMQHTRPREVAVEFVQKDAPQAIASTQPAVAPVASAETTAPAKRKNADEEVYTGRTAAAQRVIDDAPEAEDDTTATASVFGRLRRRPAKAADTTAAGEAAEAVATEAPAPTSAPAAPQPAAGRGLYTGTAPQKQLPTSAPVADEPRPGEEPLEDEAPKPAAVAAEPTPAPQPASPVPKPATTTAAAAPAPTVRPTATPAPKPAAQPVASTAKMPIPADGQHTVQPRETLYGVARQYALRPADLIAWNRLPANPALKPGQVLRLTPADNAGPAVASTTLPTATKPAAPAPPVSAPGSASTSVPAAAAGGMIKHTVAPGESMYAISRKYGVTIKQIMEWNNKPDFNVRPGEVLTVKPAR